MPAANDSTWMQQAIRLAINGRGTAEPNPLVGCVIVKNGRVIGSGFHQKYGQAHAEINALDACGENPAGAAAFVTLEPCCHAQKQTPPCVPRLIQAGLARVVAGCVDPEPLVSGKGVAQLRAAGIDVQTGVLELQAKQLIAPYLARLLHKRPYVTLKWAQSRDGLVAGRGGRRMQIANNRSLSLMHQLRARSDAILVGINTVLSDDPLLTARRAASPRSLMRIVLDRALRIPLDSQLVRTAKQPPTWVFSRSPETKKVEALRAAGVNVQTLHDPDGPLPELLAWLGTQKITHLLVEPGPTLAKAFLTGGFADRVWIFDSPQRIDEPGSPAAAKVNYPTTGQLDLDGDVLTEYLNPSSEVFFSSTPSPDFVLGG